MTEKQEDIRSRILEQASSYMFRYGIKRLTMEGLAADTGISKKTLYAYFGGKRELVDEIVRQSLEEVARSQNELLENSEPSTVEILKSVFIPIQKLAARMDRIFYEDLARYYPDVWKNVQETRLKRMQTVAEMLNDKLDTYLVRKYGAGIISNLIITSLSSFTTPENIVRLGITPAEAIQLFFDTVVVGLLDEKERKEIRSENDEQEETKHKGADHE